MCVVPNEDDNVYIVKGCSDFSGSANKGTLIWSKKEQGLNVH